jgi:hypothetical protein
MPILDLLPGPVFVGALILLPDRRTRFRDDGSPFPCVSYTKESADINRGQTTFFGKSAREATG